MRDVPRDKFGMAGAGRTTIFQLALALGVALAFTIIGRPDNPQAALDGLQATWILGIACYIFQIFLCNKVILYHMVDYDCILFSFHKNLKLEEVH